MEREAQTAQLLAELCGVVFPRFGVLVEVSDAFLVLVKTEVQIPALESFVAVFFQLACDLDDLLAFELFALVFGKVFVGVAGGIDGFLLYVVYGVAFQLAAIWSGQSANTLGCHALGGRTYDGDILCGLIVHNLKVLDLPYDAFAIQHLSKDYMLAIEMWCGNRSNEEL